MPLSSRRPPSEKGRRSQVTVRGAGGNHHPRDRRSRWSLTAGTLRRFSYSGRSSSCGPRGGAVSRPLALRRYLGRCVADSGSDVDASSHNRTQKTEDGEPKSEAPPLPHGSCALAIRSPTATSAGWRGACSDRARCSSSQALVTLFTHSSRSGFRARSSRSRRARGGRVTALAEGTAIEESVRQTARIEEAARRLGSLGTYARVASRPTRRLWPAPTSALRRRQSCSCPCLAERTPRISPMRCVRRSRPRAWRRR